MFLLLLPLRVVVPLPLVLVVPSPLPSSWQGPLARKKEQ
jgi:hypothetical protein